MRTGSISKIAALLWVLWLIPVMSANAGDGATVVFICDHGNAKSLIAATLFNREAGRRHLPFHAVARGVSPAPGIPESVAAGLRRDGYDVSGFEGKPITTDDLQKAAKVVLINVDRTSVPASSPEKTDTWTGIPAVSDGYPQARDAIAHRVDLLLQLLAGHGQPVSP